MPVNLPALSLEWVAMPHLTQESPYPDESQDDPRDRQDGQQGATPNRLPLAFQGRELISLGQGGEDSRAGLL